MIKIDDKLISEDLREVHFVCNLQACKGACCIEGDAGAPLDKDELPILEKIYPEVRPYLSKKSRKAIREQGTYVEEEDGDFVTPLVEGKECAYVIMENGIAFCGIEKAWRDGAIDWPKPISCHLYPVRINRLRSVDLEVLNYEKWSICAPACSFGEKKQVPLYKFLEVPLTRKFGEEFYRRMCEIFEEMDKE